MQRLRKIGLVLLTVGLVLGAVSAQETRSVPSEGSFNVTFFDGNPYDGGEVISDDFGNAVSATLTRI